MLVLQTRQQQNDDAMLTYIVKKKAERDAGPKH
jgi:hypothetical protein